MDKKHQAIIKGAMRILEEHARYADGELFTETSTSKQYMRLRLGTAEREIFTVAFLDNRNRLIECEDLFFGTIDASTVHPREVFKRAFELNAAAMILAHNHPSGVRTPSQADIELTELLNSLGKKLGVRVLDHIVVGRGDALSMRDAGLF